MLEKFTAMPTASIQNKEKIELPPAQIPHQRVGCVNGKHLRDLHCEEGLAKFDHLFGFSREDFQQMAFANRNEAATHRPRQKAGQSGRKTRLPFESLRKKRIFLLDGFVFGENEDGSFFIVSERNLKPGDFGYDNRPRCVGSSRHHVTIESMEVPPALSLDPYLSPPPRLRRSLNISTVSSHSHNCTG